MKGEVNEPIKLVLLTHQLNLPKEIANLIVKFAIPIMYCSKCGVIIQKDYRRTKNLGWSTDFSNPKGTVKCLKCLPNLQELYRNKKLRDI
jgi:hypothetical protein